MTAGPNPPTDPAGEVDPLTGLIQRHRLRQIMDRALTARGQDTPRPALVILDLDRFKAVNDSAGHDTGDGVLQRVVRRIRTAAGPGAVLARTSGDEFAVFLPDGAGAAALAETLLDLVGRPYAVNGHAITISASIGIARWPEDGGDADALLRAATIALHQAEAEGRNRHRAFDPSMQDRARLRLALEADLRAALALQQVELRQALSLDQFVLHYQPQVDLATGRLTGFEALLRWQHPARGLVGPDSFIPLAESIGAIGLLGAWVLRTACLAAARWPVPAHGRPLRVAVNLSPLQLREGRALVAAVAEALARAGLPPERLEIELTESALAEDSGDALGGIHELGVALAIDDFGTGYSSLSRIAQLPFDRLKIDRSFIRDLGGAGPTHRRRSGTADAAWMIRAIAALGAGLGVATVAEGVETAAQASLVQAAGVTEMQGFLVSRAVPEAEVPGLIARLDHAAPVLGAAE